MKKFYAFAAAALMAVAANAQTLYIVGAGDGLGWTPDEPATMEMVGGNYVMEVSNLTQFKLSTVMGDWATWNTGAYGCNYGEQAGVAVALEPGYTENINTPWKGDYTITVAADLSIITLTTNTPKPSEDALPEIYFRGDMNSWNPEAAWQFEALSKTTFRFVCAEGQSIKVGEGFKVADADWNKYNYGNGSTVIFDMENEVFHNGENMAIDEEFNGIAWLNTDIEGAAFLTLSNDKTYTPDWFDPSAVEAIDVENAPVYYFNLQGVRVENPANGIFVKVVGNKATKVVK